MREVGFSGIAVSIEEEDAKTTRGRLEDGTESREKRAEDGGESCSRSIGSKGAVSLLPQKGGSREQKLMVVTRQVSSNRMKKRFRRGFDRP